MSLFQTILFFYKKHSKIEVEIISKEVSHESLVLGFYFTNLSDLPISIHLVEISEQNDKWYKCLLLRSWIGEKYYPKFPETDLPRTERIYSEEFPINLMSYQSKFSFIKFELPPKMNNSVVDNSIKIKIRTNRKKFMFECNLKTVNYKNSPII